MKRKLLRLALRTTGITSACWRLLRPNLYCFNYHRIGQPENCDFDRGVFSCTPEQFREQLAVLRERFEVINLDRLLALMKSGQTPRQPLALLTFDDGYLDNYLLAYPVLKEFGMTAVFFIPTSFVESRKVPWWDEIAWNLRHSSVDRIRLRDGGTSAFELGNGLLEQTTQRVLNLVKHRRHIRMTEQLQEIREACRPCPPLANVNQQLFLSWSHLREMQSAGMDIGSHSHSHEVLSHLDLPSQRTELERSKEILEAQLGIRVSAVAYPAGTRATYTADTCRLAESVGYQLGFNFLGTRNSWPLDNPFDIGRQGVNKEMDVSGLKFAVCFPSLC